MAAGRDLGTRLRVSVDGSLCQGHARCNAIAPDLFLIDEFGYAYVDHDDVPDGFEESARLAAATCPERAIKLVGRAGEVG